MKWGALRTSSSKAIFTLSFRFGQRVLQLGDLQGRMQEPKSGGIDDLSLLWTDEVRQMCHNDHGCPHQGGA